MFLVILRVIYQKRSRWAAQYDIQIVTSGSIIMRKPIQGKPLVITTCRHCSWKPNDPSQLSHFGRQSGLQILKRQTSRRWLASYRSWEPNDDRWLSHYDCQSGLPVIKRQTSKRSVTSWFSTLCLRIVSHYTRHVKYLVTYLLTYLLMRGMQHRTTGGKAV